MRKSIQFLITATLLTTLINCNTSSLPEGAALSEDGLLAMSPEQVESLGYVNPNCITTAYMAATNGKMPSASISGCPGGGGPGPGPGSGPGSSCNAPAGYSRIYTEQDLSNIRNNLAGNYFLCNDITLTAPFEQIKDPNPNANFSDCAVNGTNCPISFTGILDGNNKRIVNLTMSGETGGLIFETRGILRNLRIENPNLSIQHGGALVASNSGRIENCSVGGLGFVDGGTTGTYIGGLVGSNWYPGLVSNSNVSGNILVRGRYAIGGVAGFSGDGTFDSVSVRQGVLVIGGSGIGGIVGASEGTGFSYSSSVGDLISRSYVDDGVSVVGYDAIGGFVGYVFYGFNIQNSFSKATVYGSGYHTGGLIGLLGAADYGQELIENTRVDGDVVGFQLVGGLVGGLYSLSYSDVVFRNSLFTGILTGQTSLGGILGYNQPNGDPEILAVYFNQDSNPNLPSSQYGVGKTAQELKTLSTFEPAWSMSYIGDPTQTTWKLASPDGTAFPRLAWELE